MVTADDINLFFQRSSQDFSKGVGGGEGSHCVKVRVLTRSSWSFSSPVVACLLKKGSQNGETRAHPRALRATPLLYVEGSPTSRAEVYIALTLTRSLVKGSRTHHTGFPQKDSCLCQIVFYFKNSYYFSFSLDISNSFILVQ